MEGCVGYRAFSSRDHNRILEINRHLGVQLVQYAYVISITKLTSKHYK